MFSIYILTHNEEIDIGACLESAALCPDICDDIVVVDSCSTDRTAAIVQDYATRLPLRWVQHPFESHGRQRTWMLENIPAKHEWVYILEADERMTPALLAECDRRVQADRAPAGTQPQDQDPETGPIVGYYVAERVMFMNTWIRRSTQYPRYQLRLLRVGSVWFEDYGHTEREVCHGPTGFLQETYPHYTCSKGFSRWIEKHNRYSSDEAQETLRQLAQGSVNWSDLLWGKTEVARRRALKNLSLRLPGRPLLRFLYMYFLLGAIWDGPAGFTWCVLQAFYEYLIVLKVWELRHNPPPPAQKNLQ